jgi:hypothetical protein
MNDRSEQSSGHLGAKMGEVVEATLQEAPNRSGLLCANVVRANIANVTQS